MLKITENLSLGAIICLLGGKKKELTDVMGLYESGNGQSIRAYKIIDATHLCQEAERCIIKYANVVRGRIAQICKWENVDSGVAVHYHINEMDIESLASDEVFELMARIMGADAGILAEFIYDNQA